MVTQTKLPIAICIAFLFSALWVEQAHPLAEMESETLARQRQLIQYLRSSEGFDFMRASEELVVRGNFPQAVRQELLKVLRQKCTNIADRQAFRYVDVLAAAGAEAIPDILQQFS